MQNHLAKNVAVIIPAYKPSEKLLALVTDLYASGLKNVVIVNDGSGQKYQPIFEELKNKNCYILNHDVNKGKGRALKSAFNFCLNEFENINGVVTMDADGQHALCDVLNVVTELSLNQLNLILGARNLDKSIPFRSKLGNIITKKVFAFITGQHILDTQTGLRGIPVNFLPQFIKLSGERYEYEMNMLLATRKLAVMIKEVPIKTIYIDDNKDSHFNPIKDSFKIYSLIFRFIISSFVDNFLHFFKYLKTLVFRKSKNN